MVRALLDLAAGRLDRAAPAEETLRLVAAAALAVTALAALYGVAVGSTEPVLALHNAWKVPMVLVLSAATALPAGVLAHHLAGAKRPGVDLLVGLAAGNLSAAMVLASMAPLVAIYYQTSEVFGGFLAICAGFLALAVGIPSGARATLRRRDEEEARSPMLSVALAVTVVVQMAALLQFIHVASPILPEITPFADGLDGLLRW